VTTIEPRDSTDQSMMWRLASGWVRDRPPEGSGNRLLDTYLEVFQSITEGALLHDVPKAPLPVNSGKSFGWIIGRALPKSSPPAVPVATVQVDRDDAGTVTRCCIRVAIFEERHDGSIDVHGWRFELEEDGDGALHPYQHSQPIIGWTISGRCLLHPPGGCVEDCDGVDLSGVDEIDADRLAAKERQNQSHPAFPLPTTTMTGLMAVVIATLYGARTLRALVESDSRLNRASGPVGEDLRRVTG
jgi:hypothetical protein